MKEPIHNDYFPLSEYKDRIARLRKEMALEGLDAMLISTEPALVYATGFLNGYWICTMHDDAQLALIPADAAKDPVLMIPDHLLQVADTSCISDIRTWTQFAGGKSKGSIETVTDTFLGLKLDSGRIGMEIGPHDRPGMSIPFIEELHQRMPKAEFADMGNALSRVCRIKSPLERDKMRTACRITCDAVKVGLDAMKEGMSEKELGQVMGLEMARQSPDACVNKPWFLFVYASGRGVAAFDGVATSYRFQKGDAIYIDVGFKYQGYGADMIRCASIGKPDPELLRYYNAALETNMATVEFIKPGIKGKDLYNYWAEQVRKIGFEDSMKVLEDFDWDFLGHGLGITTHEIPLLNSTCEDVLEPGMVMAIEGNVFDALPFSKTKYAFKNEEDVLVTEAGHEWLTPLPNHLYVVDK